MKRLGRTAPWAALLALATGCQGGDTDPPSVERRDSAGVEIVSVAGGDRPLGWRIHPLDTLVGPGTPAGAAGTGPQGVGVGPDGRIYVLDQSARRVIALSEDGQPLTAFGELEQEDRGLQAPTLLTVAPEGTVAVFDRPRRGVALFAPDGAAQGVWTLPQPLLGERLAWTERGLLAVIGELDTAADSIRHRLVAYTPQDAGAEEIALHERPAPRLVEGCGLMRPMPRIFEPELVWDAADEVVAVSTGADYRIRIIGGQGSTREIRRATRSRRTTAELAARAVGDTVRLTGGGRECAIPPAEAAEQAGRAPTLPEIRRLALGPEGSLWVERQPLPREPATIDVFGADGEYQGTLPAGTPFPAAFVHAGRYVTVEPTEGGASLVLLMEIEAGESPDA